jgi:hypothetical protein
VGTLPAFSITMTLCVVEGAASYRFRKAEEPG